MIADHIVFPFESRFTYPYTLDGKHPSGGDALETFSILGLVVGATERLRLVTCVLVLPYRNPVLTAKKWRPRWMCCPVAAHVRRRRGLAEKS